MRDCLGHDLGNDQHKMTGRAGSLVKDLIFGIGFVVGSVHRQLGRLFLRQADTVTASAGRDRAVSVSPREGMKIGQVDEELKSLGWQLSRDEGYRIATFRLSDRSVSMIYGVQDLKDKKQLWMTPSIRTHEFSFGCATIDPGYGESAPFVRHLNFPDICAPEILEQHVRQASDMVIKWARHQNLDKALDEHAALPANVRGAGPIWHLAALALSGNVGRLKFYLECLDAGDRLGFVNYITRGHVERALQLAEGRASGTDIGSQRGRETMTAVPRHSRKGVK